VTITTPRPAAAAADLRTDRYVWPTMTRLAECLCRELIDAGLPPTCFCGVMPGELVDASYVTAKEGMAWVRMVGAYPYSVFPAADQTGAVCTMPLAFELEVGALWCAPVARDSRGNAPTQVAQFASTEVQIAAMAAMHRAILCCMPRQRGTAALGQYAPVGPEGGTVGGTWAVYVAAADQLGVS
jgi:hypothetical protein